MCWRMELRHCCHQKNVFFSEKFDTKNTFWQKMELHLCCSEPSISTLPLTVQGQIALWYCDLWLNYNGKHIFVGCFWFAVCFTIGLINYICQCFWFALRFAKGLPTNVYVQSVTVNLNLKPNKLHNIVQLCNYTIIFNKLVVLHSNK